MFKDSLSFWWKYKVSVLKERCEMTTNALTSTRTVRAGLSAAATLNYTVHLIESRKPLLVSYFTKWFLENNINAKQSFWTCFLHFETSWLCATCRKTERNWWLISVSQISTGRGAHGWRLAVPFQGARTRGALTQESSAARNRQSRGSSVTWGWLPSLDFTKKYICIYRGYTAF